MLHQRNEAAIAQVGALCPANAAEAALAAQYVALSAQVMACLRLANLRATGLEMGLKCDAQAASMSRQSQSALRTLLRMQAVRKKRDANAVTADAAAWTERVAIAYMTEKPTAPPLETEAPPTGPIALPEMDMPEVAMPEVELYEHLYPQRAALIRQHGGVPPDVSFGPPGEEIVRALVTGRSPAPRSQDRGAA
jgi:hypothetical protein